MSEGVGRGGGKTLWLQIQEALEGEIRAGIHAPGAQLPTEHALATRFGVNRHTVRRGLTALEEKGLVRVAQGKGSFVHEHVTDYAIRKRTRFSEIVTAQDRRPGGLLLGVKTSRANAGVARDLNLRGGAKILVMRILGEADGRPITVADHHFAADRFPGIVEAYRETQSISAALARLGVADYSRRVTRVTAQMPGKEVADLLQQPSRRPVLVAESVNVDPNGRPVEYGITRFAGDRVQIVFEP